MGLLRPLRLSPQIPSVAAVVPVTSSSIFSANPPSIFKITVGIFSTASVGSRSLNLGRRGLRVGTVLKMAAQPPGPVQKSEDEWRAVLSPEQFRILRMKGTENEVSIDNQALRLIFEQLSICEVDGFLKE